MLSFHCLLRTGPIGAQSPINKGGAHFSFGGDCTAKLWLTKGFLALYKYGRLSIEMSEQSSDTESSEVSEPNIHVQLRIFELMHEKQDRASVHALRNYKIYWNSCSARLHHLRKQTGLVWRRKQGKKAPQFPSHIENAQIMEILLLLAERAWACAEQLSKENSTNEAHKQQ
ncbi:MAG: hypothetical protein EZS28_051034, partial [Streblomastix strix]